MHIGEYNSAAMEIERQQQPQQQQQQFAKASKECAIAAESSHNKPIEAQSKYSFSYCLVLRLHCSHLLIFIAGTFVAILFYELGYNSWQMHLQSSRQLQHLPQQHYLQARDDFIVHSQDANNQRRAIKEFYGEGGAAMQQPHDEVNIKEALSSLQLAQEMRSLKKVEKAQRLYEHAYALAPKHAEVLLRYGEFLEHQQRDIVLADQYYFKALILHPSNSEALMNRQRTAQIVQSLDERRLLLLDQKRDALSAVHESSAALRRAKKEAYFQHIYHSVGIEGNTMTLAQTRSILETRMAIDGKSIAEHNEILGMDLAMKFINASLVNKLDITLKDILELHRRVLGHVDPIEGGEFRRTQVYVGGHIPPGPGDLALLMRSFEIWLNSEQSISMHPVKHAAFAHYKLVHIHPFIDGNGRTSRLLMNTLLMRAGYPPVIIPKQQRHKYYNYLQLANEGDIRPFVRFIAECTEKTLDLYLWATSDLPQQIPMLAPEEHDLSANTLQTSKQSAPSSSSSSNTCDKLSKSSKNDFDDCYGDFFESGSAELP